MTYGEDIKYQVVLFQSKYINSDLINSFDCGNKDINDYLKKVDKVFNDGMGVTKLIINEDETKLIGFYTLASSSMLQTIDKYNRALPAIEIKMFAMDLKYQDILCYKDMEYEKYTFISALFSDIIDDIVDLSNDIIGIKYIILQSVPKAIKFYRRSSFYPIHEVNEYLELPYDRFSTGCKEMCYVI